MGQGRFPQAIVCLRVERSRKHGWDQRVREEVRWMVVRAVVQRCQNRMKRETAFKEVAAELQGRRWGWVRTLFYEEASKRWRALFRDPELTPAEVTAILRKSRVL